MGVIVSDIVEGGRKRGLPPRAGARCLDVPFVYITEEAASRSTPCSARRHTTRGHATWIQHHPTQNTRATHTHTLVRRSSEKASKVAPRKNKRKRETRPPPPHTPQEGVAPARTHRNQRAGGRRRNQLTTMQTQTLERQTNKTKRQKRKRRRPRTPQLLRR